MELLISPGGVVRCIYGEDIALTELGHVLIRRASHVEPDAAGKWWADLAPVGGPVLGPFGRRSEALGAETKWLSAYLAESHAQQRRSDERNGRHFGAVVDPAGCRDLL